MKITNQQFREELYNIQTFRMPTVTDIAKAEVASLTCQTIREFAEFLQQDELTIKIWCRKSPAYYKALNSWEQMATYDIKKALAKRAVGFKKTVRKDVLTKAGQVETLEIETYYPPDTAAAQFWLKNRDPEEWKDKSEVDINVTANIRAWLVEAGDDKDLIDVTPTEVQSLPLAGVSETLNSPEFNAFIQNEGITIVSEELHLNTQLESSSETLEESSLNNTIIIEQETHFTSATSDGSSEETPLNDVNNNYDGGSPLNITPQAASAPPGQGEPEAQPLKGVARTPWEGEGAVWDAFNRRWI